MLTRNDGWGAPPQGKVLIVDDDRDITELVHAILTDEGFAVALLNEQDPNAVRITVNQLEPDCVLLDGASQGDYGPSWLEAAWISGRDRPVPLIMFTAHRAALDEAEARESGRSRDARFTAVLPKPFDLDHLVETVALAVGLAVPFDRSPSGEERRTTALVERLESVGATDIHASTMREWVSFLTPGGVFVQLYWWQRDGVYYVIRYADSGGRLETIGQFYDLGDAIDAALTLTSDSPVYACDLPAPNGQADGIWLISD